MGSSHSTNQEKFKDAKTKQLAEDNQLQKLQTIDDPTFEEIQIYQIQDSQNSHRQQQQQDFDSFIAVKQRIIENKNNFQNMQKEAERKLNYSHPNLLSLHGYKFSSSNEICGSTNISFLYYEYYTHNLDTEITRRHKKAQYFQEQELWYLLESLASVGYFLQQNGICHGDIRPINVYLNPKGEAKLGDHPMVNSQKNGYIKTIMGSTTTNLSPQLLQALKKKKNDPEHNEYKSDLFSLGLTILEAATLLSSQTIYNWENLSIKFGQIQDLLERARARYSSQLLNVIEMMLEENEDFRPDFIQLIDTNHTIKQNLGNFSDNNNNDARLNLAQQSTHNPPAGFYYDFSPSKNNTLESQRNTSVIYTQSSPSKQYSQLSQTPLKYDQNNNLNNYNSLNTNNSNGGGTHYVNTAQGPYIPQQYSQQQYNGTQSNQQQTYIGSNTNISFNNTSQNNNSYQNYNQNQYMQTLPSREQTPQKDYYLDDKQYIPFQQQQQQQQQQQIVYPSHKIIYNRQPDEIIQNQNPQNFIKNRQQIQQQQQQSQQQQQNFPQARHMYKY